MSTWQRIDANGEAHQLNAKEDKRARQKFRMLMDSTVRRAEWDPETRVEIDEDPDHVIVSGRRRDGTSVAFIGSARQMHGPDGVCTCCCGRGDS